MNKIDLTLDEMITVAQSRLEKLRDKRTGVLSMPIENGTALRRIHEVLTEIQSRLTPFDEGNRRIFEEELAKHD
jgi:hypothetical protein